MPEAQQVRIVQGSTSHAHSSLRFTGDVSRCNMRPMPRDVCEKLAPHQRPETRFYAPLPRRGP
jgi:hypothetical protein